MKKLVLLTVVAAVLAAAAPARADVATCPDTAGRGHLNVLTINILYTDFLHRGDSLETIADFIASESAAGEPVDVIMLQEVVSGVLAGTFSASINLSRLLREQGFDYNLRFWPVAGLPGIFMVGNAMLSRCAVSHFATRLLPYAGEAPLGGLGVPVLHEAQRMDIDIPTYGEAAVYNTHLCSFCTGQARLRQTKGLLRFLDRWEDADSGLVVLGGDFNTDITVAGDVPAYDLLTQDHNFTDTYAAANACTDCCSGSDLSGCTYAVAGNPFVSGSQPVRIDYIFVRGDFETLESRVVFNEAPWVSDHSGVLSRIGLQ